MRIPYRSEAPCRATATLLLEAGFWPVAIEPGQKKPVGTAWGLERPTVASLGELYRRHPGAGVGLLLGPRGLVIDIECDGQEGETSLNKLLEGRLILTAGWRSARGRHRLFLYDPAMEALGRSIVKDDEFPDLELRLGSGAKQIQSVVPPTGGRTWNGIKEIARLPGEVLGKLREHQTPISEHQTDRREHQTNGRRTSIAAILGDRALQRATGYLAACPGAVSGQGGHDTTFRIACHVGPGFNLSPAECLHLLVTIYNPRCEPPWSIKELEHKVLDAYKIEPRRGWLYEKEK